MGDRLGPEEPFRDGTDESTEDGGISWRSPSMTRPTNTRDSSSTLKTSIVAWLSAAERELRLAFEAVQRDGTDAARARYARARKDLDAAFETSTHLLRFPDAPESRS